MTRKELEELAEKFEQDVYLADPEMVDSPPSKLWLYGFLVGRDASAEVVRKKAYPEGIDQFNTTAHGLLIEIKQLGEESK